MFSCVAFYNFNRAVYIWIWNVKNTGQWLAWINQSWKSLHSVLFFYTVCDKTERNTGTAILKKQLLPQPHSFPFTTFARCKSSFLELPFNCYEVKSIPPFKIRCFGFQMKKVCQISRIVSIFVLLCLLWFWRLLWKIF